ncbi:MAG TPA: hypothetical protein PK263_01855, partial [bacterium]|nr:hypothetical protein [bacterium]
MEPDLDKKIARLYTSGLSVQQVSDCLHLGCSKIRYSLEKQSISRRDHSSASKMLHMTKFGRKGCLIKSQLTEQEERLKLSGIMLYWGEGTKLGNSVVFSNSDPDMIKLFLDFLRQVCMVDETRLRLLLHAYSDQDEAGLRLFWSNITGIPITQFSKTFLHSRKGGTYKKTSDYGTISLRYSDKELLDVINGWI